MSITDDDVRRFRLNMLDVLDVLSKIRWCSDETFAKYEKAVHRILNLAQDEPSLHKILGFYKQIYVNKLSDNEITQPKKYKRNLGRERAFEYCKDIHEKLRSINGILVGSKDTDFRFMIVRKVWVWGSTAKGSTEPNDLDLLYDFDLISIRTNREKDLNIEEQFHKFILGGKRQTTFHDYSTHDFLAKDHKIEIYPKFKLKF